MSLTTRRAVDPDGELRVLYAVVAGSLLVGMLASFEPMLALAATGLLALVTVAIGLQVAGRLDPLWFLAVVAAMQPLNGLRVLEFVTYGDVLLVLTGAFVLILTRRAVVPQHALVVLVGTLVITAGGIFGMMVDQDWGGVTEMAKFVFGAPLVIVIVMLIDPDRRLAVLLATAYAMGAAASTVAAFWEPVDPEFGRSAGWGAHAGHLALAGIFGFFVFLAWVILARTVLMKVAASLGAALCLYGIMLSGTRSALIGFAVGVLFLTVIARAKGLLVLASGFAGLAAFYFLVVPYLPFRNNIQRAFGQGELAGSSSYTVSLHAEALEDAFRLIGRHPWSGVGFSEGQTAHNMVLQVASLGGLVALAGLVIAWFPIVLLACTYVSRTLNARDLMPQCLLAGVLAYFVFAQFQPLIWDRHLWFFIAVTIYVCVRLPTQRPDHEEVPDVERLGSR